MGPWKACWYNVLLVTVKCRVTGMSLRQKKSFSCFCVIWIDRTCFSCPIREDRGTWNSWNSFPPTPSLIIISIPAFPMGTGLLFRQGRQQPFDSATRWGRKRHSSGRASGSCPDLPAARYAAQHGNCAPSESPLMTFSERRGNETTC